MKSIRLRQDGTLSLYEVMRYKYMGKGWAIEYADSEGNYGEGDPLTGAERLIWEDEGEAPVQADLEAEESDDWKTYRQALRDLPSNTTDPFNPTWPTKPS